MKIRVRFHLGKGKNFRKWQIKGKDSEGKLLKTSYFPPEGSTIVMHGCKLVVRERAAQKIHAGANKSVCAWVECDGIAVSMLRDVPGKVVGVLSFNPRKNSHWTMTTKNESFDCAIEKNQRFATLVTLDRQILIVCPSEKEIASE